MSQFNFIQKFIDSSLFLTNDSVFFPYLFLLEENLLFAHVSEFLGQKLSLRKWVYKDQVHHAYIRVENGLQKNTSLYALHTDLSCHLLDGNVVGDLEK